MNKTLTNKSANLVLELRQETMSAWLTIKQSKHLINEQDILMLIEEAGIKTGFEEALAYIRENSLEKDYDVPFPVAICSAGKSESTLHYRFNPDQQLDPSAPVSFPDLERISPVHSGAVVADYSNNLFEQGGSIYDIFGELIDQGSINEEQALSLAGINVHFDVPNREFTADTAGYPYLDAQGRICILDKLILSAEDLPSQAVFRSPVDVHIQGSLTHVKLFCSGNLHITGDLHSSALHAQKDLYLEGDIVYCNTEAVRVDGELNCINIVDSKVFCNHNLCFSGCIENSSIACDGDILGGESSIIKGGNVQAGGSLSVACVGDTDGSTTEIEIAISPFYRSLLMQMTRELVRLKDDPDGNADAIEHLQHDLRKCEQELDEQLNKFLQRSLEDRKKVSILQEVLPPTSIRVLKHSYHYNSVQKVLELVEKE